MQVMEATFPDSSNTTLGLDLTFEEPKPDTKDDVGDMTVATAQFRHGAPEGPFHACRIEVDCNTLAYTGDTEWVDALVDRGFLKSEHADMLVFTNDIEALLDTCAAYEPPDTPKWTVPPSAKP